MTTSTPASTSSAKCTCANRGHDCNNKAAAAPRKLGFFASRPWLFVIAAFFLMFTAWTIMFSMAAMHPVASVPMVSAEDK